MDELANDEINDKWKPKGRGNAASVRVLSITVDGDDKENIELVPVKASAGYLNGYADPEYIAELPKFSRSEEHTSELQSLMRISYAVFCLKKKKRKYTTILT